MRSTIFFLKRATAIVLLSISSLLLAATPQLVWEVATPNTLANSIRGVGWSPSGARVAVGSTDRWLRTRQASNGALQYSVLQPHRSGGVEQVIYSSDGQYLAVRNSSSGFNFLVHRASDGAFLGILVSSIGANDLVSFAPDGSRLVTTGYLPYVDASGLWQQKGIIRFWRIGDGTMQRSYDDHTGIGVTSPVAFSPDASQFVYGTYEGTASVARTPPL